MRVRLHTTTKLTLALALALATVPLACSGGSDSTTPTQPPPQVGAVRGSVKDTSGAAFLPYTMTFTTGTGGGTTDPDIAFEQVPLTNATAGSYTCVQVGPDGKLYASTIDGLIQRFTINPDGTLSSPDDDWLNSCQTASPSRSQVS